YKQPVLIEKFLNEREFTVGILGTGKKARVLGIMEVIIKEEKFANICGVEAKEACEAYVEYRLLPTRLERDIVTMVLKTHRILNCRDVSRIDVRLDEKGHPHIMEVNPLPGLHPTHSDLPILAEKVGIPYKTLISIILKSALRRMN
ncbi:MAG: D-alanine--D-alanine ligase, partial [Candidatus Desulfofervidaceae bacterium]|nr:D-alanine--D-alanine ligase [Candidatus Desulfofervidaceae bacterium]